MSAPRKVYLGDGAYVVYDGFGLMLTTENGVSTTNRAARQAVEAS